MLIDRFHAQQMFQLSFLPLACAHSPHPHLVEAELAVLGAPVVLLEHLEARVHHFVLVNALALRKRGREVERVRMNDWQWGADVPPTLAARGTGTEQPLPRTATATTAFTAAATQTY